MKHAAGINGDSIPYHNLPQPENRDLFGVKENLEKIKKMLLEIIK